MVSAPYERKNEGKKIIAVRAVKAHISKSILPTYGRFSRTRSQITTLLLLTLFSVPPFPSDVGRLNTFGEEPSTTEEKPKRSCCIFNSITNLSKYFSHAALTALSKGLGFIPTPTHPSKLKLKTDVRELSRSMHVKHHFRNSRKAFTPQPFKKKSKWDPGSTTNSNLARYLELLLSSCLF